MAQDLAPLINALSGLVDTMQKQQQTSNVKEILQTQIITFEPFDECLENFNSYSQRLENFFKLKGLNKDDIETNEAKVMVLINCLGSRHYKLLSSLTSPDLPASKTYTELMTLLKNHLAPRKNVVAEQHKFFSRIQFPGESLANYVAALKELVKDCEFKAECNNAICSKSIVNLLLRAQFIRGLSDIEIREKLLQQDHITFDKTFEIALTIEASKIYNRETYKSLSTNTVNQVNTSQSAPIKRKSNISSSKFNNRNRSPGQSWKSSRNVDLQKIGLDGLCLHCGRNNHTTQDCYVVDRLQCKNCQKAGHIAKVCITSLLKNTKQTVQNIDIESDSAEEYSINQIIDVFTETSSFVYEPKMLLKIKIKDKVCNFECDTGSPVTIISQKDFDALKLNIPLQKTNVHFRSYTKHIFKPLGYVKVPVSFKEKRFIGDLYVVPDYGSAIIGRRWVRALNINLHDIDSVSIQSNVSEILEEYKDLFQSEVGKIPDFICSLSLRPDARPIYIKPRRVPYALQEEVERELDCLENQGIIEKVDHSEWGTPLVVIPKSDGKIRLCADYKVTVNNQLRDNRYPIPKIEDIFNKMKNGKYYCTLDIFKAYLHVPVDDQSARIQAISTHRGTYLAKRLFFGIKTAPNEFHKIIDQIVHDLDGTTVYFDDILVQGCTVAECESRLIKVFERMRKYNLHLNRNKCRFFENRIKYLGHVISEKGLEKSNDKIKAVLDAPRPKNVEELKQFLGLIMYYAKFIQNASTILHSLNRLLRKDVEYKWTIECETAFQKAKVEIASDQVLMPFTAELPVTLATDASPYGISAVLSHRLPNGTERPIAFISRSLTKAERNYSQLDREAMAIYWAFKKLFQYIYGRKFTLIVDNKPLTTIFNPGKQLPILSATRMLRYAQYLSGFNYTIEHRKSTEHANADYFSRNPLKISKEEELALDDEHVLNVNMINQICSETITAKEIATETNNDPELSKLKNDLLDGTIRECEFSIQDGILLRGNRVVIPKKLQCKILKELHSTHIGMVKMKAIARNHCYWKGIDSDIENLVKSCLACCNTKCNPVKAPIHQWEPPVLNWQRVHMDYAGPFLGHHFLIVVDAKSKWPEMCMTKNAPTTAGTICYLREIFSRHGLPEILVSDNASIFKSAEFKEFCQRNGINQRWIAPGHPATNGQAERYCQTLKTKLKCMMHEPSGSLHEKLHSFLLRYRVTPLACGKSPAELLFRRNLRTKLDLIRPQTYYLKNKTEQPNFNKHFNMGDRVQSRNYSGSMIWKYGTVVKCLGRLHYLIELDDGYIIKRHSNQLRLCQVEIPTRPAFPVSIPITDTQITNQDENNLSKQSSIEYLPEAENESVTESSSLDTSPEEMEHPESRRERGQVDLRVSIPNNDIKETELPELRRSTRTRRMVERFTY